MPTRGSSSTLRNFGASVLGSPERELALFSVPVVTLLPALYEMSHWAVVLIDAIDAVAVGVRGGDATTRSNSDAWD
jgi:hypothetical protein